MLEQPGPAKATLLYYSELSHGAIGVDDSLVEGLIKKALKAFLNTIVVYYDRQATVARQLADGTISIPYHRRSRLIDEVAKFLDPNMLDFTIVRNTPSALRDVLHGRRHYRYKAGFHPTFPHALRRVHEAQLTGAGLLRKQIEYRFKRHQLNRLAAQCDFVMSSSDRMIDGADARNAATFFRLHNGFDDELVPGASQQAEARHGALRFVYSGSVDMTRRADVILGAFDDLSRDDWRLDMFTTDVARAKEVVGSAMRRRHDQVHIIPAIDRASLFRRLSECDVGICLIPVTPLYAVSSPLKMTEYYACGIPAVMTRLPACLEAFEGRGCGFFTDFDRASIRRTIEEILSTDRRELRRMGAIGREFVRAERNYRKIAGDLAGFLQSLRPDGIPATAHASRSRSW
jgi:glycosyltransferase involved in cell wall biosynthesis